MTNCGMRRSVVSGAVAGALGSLAMDALQYRRYRTGGGDQRFGQWESSSTITSFQDAPAPAEVGRRLAERLGHPLPDRWAASTNNVVHWATGISWGVTAATLVRIGLVGAVPAGIVAAAGAFTTSYVALGLAGIYKPIWQYDAATLIKDATAHGVFGLATGTSLALVQVTGRSRARR
jgi:hypothetical protein